MSKGYARCELPNKQGGGMAFMHNMAMRPKEGQIVVFAKLSRIADNLIKNDEPLESPYLTAVKDNVTNMIAEKPPTDTPSTPVNQPNAPLTQAPASAPQPNADKEASE